MEYKNDVVIKDIVQISLPTHGDDRGFFHEIIRFDALKSARGGKEFDIKQWSHARSLKKNTLRGIHVAPWNKLIYVARGTVQSVIVDCRKESASFGKHVSIELGEGNRSAIFVPKGCGNSYLVLSEEADYMYVVDQVWAPNKEYGIAWDDPDLKIEWQLKGESFLSEKDKNLLPLNEAIEKLQP